MTGSGMVKVGIAVVLLSATAWAAGGKAEEQLSALKAAAAAKIDFAQAVREVLADGPPGAKAVEVKLAMKGEQAVYKIELLAGVSLKEIDLDAVTGKVLSAETEGKGAKTASEAAKAAGQAKLPLAEAVEVALKEHKGGQTLKAEFEVEEGKVACEVKLVAGHEFMEVEVDATTGKVLETKKEPALAALWTFDRDKVGSVPDSWRIAETNPSKKPATWKVEADPRGADKGHVLALTETVNEGRTFNLAIAEEPVFKDLDLEVKLQATAGKEDQGGGPIWRCKDENNYYVCRLNPLESNFRVYYVKDGKRKQLKTEKVEAKAGQWYAVRVRMVGPKIECDLDGKKLLEAEDSTFTEAGKVGLWTKADAATMFDDLAVMAIAEERPATKTAPATGSEHR